MENKEFDPNGTGIPNGNFFGFPTTHDEAKLILIGVPWDITTSYNSGTSKGPNAILDASTQLDFFDPNVEKAWESPISTVEPDADLIQRNHYYRSFARIAMEQLEKGGNPKDHDHLRLVRHVNRGSEYLNNAVYENTNKWLNDGKMVGVIGGDHSVPFGFIKALTEKFNSFGILQIDAHADLRKAFMGFKYSHASIMNNAISLPGIEKLIQIGLRDVCEEEVAIANNNEHIIQYYDHQLSDRLFMGESWDNITTEIVNQLPNNIYISFDIDGLNPSLCPNTGTPVPGGLEFNQVAFLLKKIAQSGKNVIGFDLCEVSPGKNNEWDANVGARVLFKLSMLMMSNGLAPAQ